VLHLFTPIDSYAQDEHGAIYIFVFSMPLAVDTHYLETTGAMYDSITVLWLLHGMMGILQGVSNTTGSV